MLAFGEELELGWPVAWAKRRSPSRVIVEDEVRRELVAADVAVEDLRDRRRSPSALSAPASSGSGGIEQMPADVVDAFVRGRVRQHDHADAALRIEADERAIAAGAAVVPDDLAVAGAVRDVPAEGDLHVRPVGRGRRAASIDAMAGASGDGCQAAARGEELQQVVGRRAQRARAGERRAGPSSARAHAARRGRRRAVSSARRRA